MNLEDMTREEIVELVGEQDLEKLAAVKAAKLSELTSDIEELWDDEDGLHSDEEFNKLCEENSAGNSLYGVEEDDPWYFTKVCENREEFLALNEIEQQTVLRWSEIEALRDHYALFEDFLYDCMTELMGFQCSELQIDIARFLQSDVQNGMIQAQRSQAKSTIVAMFAVWQLIHDCKHRVLIISAGSEVAAEIANWVIQIIMNWDQLECMRPDRQHGDRASSKAFDINWQLKGPEKSPSVACIGITANMQGRRADLLIPDDIESSKNGTTETQRMALEHLSKDFTSICQRGRIMYLGTPQTVDSIYNNLEERGFVVRVWTGRYPNEEEEKVYGDKLAPYIRNAMILDPTLRKGGGLAGDRGKPTDPVLLGEDALSKKELDQGPAYFNLQHMLNTELSDSLRHPLKPKNLIMMDFAIDQGPGEITWLPSPTRKIEAKGFNCKPELYGPFTVSEKMYDYEGKYMYVDTAGGGKHGDETVATVVYVLHGYLFFAEMLKIKGGYDDDVFDQLSELALKHNVNGIDVEKNFGFGAFASSWRPKLQAAYKKAGREGCPLIEDVWESGQKELRIIDTLEPLMARHRIIVHTDIIEYDRESVKHYPVNEQPSYQFFQQLSKISREKGALVHDDALDSFAGCCRRWVEHIAVDETIRMDQKDTDDNVEFFKSWGAEIGQFQLDGSMGNVSDRFQNTRRH